VAQLAEQLICNQQVIGSSPIIGFYRREVRMAPFCMRNRGTVAAFAPRLTIKKEQINMA
jgi:hypothetical protein